MTVRSRRLWNPTTLSAAGVVLYTVPAGRTAVVRLLVMATNEPTRTTQVELAVTPPPGSATLWRIQLSPQSSQTLVGIVLNPGDVLTGYSTLPVGGTVNPVCGGYGALLLGAPT